MARRAKKPGRASNARYVALLRGINVGGKNSVPMKELAAMFTDAGCTDVSTYIQSGNVIFEAAPALAARVPRLIQNALDEALGLRIPVIVRSAEELKAVVDANPFVRASVEPAALHVAFLADVPSTAQLDALDPDRSPPDRFMVSGRDIYMACPSGYGRSKLTNQYFDSKLGTTSTVRNWRTVLKLVELAAGS